MKKPVHVQVGDKFYRLTAIAFSHVGIDKRHGRKYYVFRCDCGNIVTTLGSHVVSGNTKSCGCLVKEVREKKRLPNNRGVINQIILQYKRHARDRGIAYHLDYDFVANIVMQPCYYCGQPPNSLKITKNCREGFRYNGIDRVDSNGVYAKDNVVPCCATCNKAKLNMAPLDFLGWVVSVYQHQYHKAELEP